MWDGVCNASLHRSKVTIQGYHLCFRKVPMSLLEVSLIFLPIKRVEDESGSVYIVHGHTYLAHAHME